MAEPPYSIEEFWEIVTALTNDMNKCAAALEILAKSEETDEDMVRFWRKMCAYTIFALIEGTTYHMMYIAYVARNAREVVFTLEELEALENAYDFDEDREVEAGLTQEQMLERIRVAFNAFARVHYSDYVLLPTPGWAGIEVTFRIKAGLSYPQSAKELEIDNGNITDMLVGAAWFMQRLVALIESCRDCAKEKVASWEDEQDEPIM